MEPFFQITFSGMYAGISKSVILHLKNLFFREFSISKISQNSRIYPIHVKIGIQHWNLISFEAPVVLSRKNV